MVASQTIRWTPRITRFEAGVNKKSAAITYGKDAAHAYDRRGCQKNWHRIPRHADAESGKSIDERGYLLRPASGSMELLSPLERLADP